MYVTIAAHDVYPDPGSGGTGRYVYETARRMVARGHRVAVVTRRRGDVPARETVDGIEVYRYDLAVAGESAPSIARQLPGVLAQIRGHAAAFTGSARPDLLSFQGPVTALLLDRVVAGDVPRVTTFHSPWPTEYAIKTRGVSGLRAIRRRLNVSLRRALEGRVLARSDGAITLSAYMRDRLAHVYDEAVSPSIVPGGVDTDQFAPDAGVYEPLVADGPAFLTVRRLSERMGHERLLASFASVSRNHPNVRLYIAGDGPLRERLEQRAVAHGVADRTTFLGYVPDEDLPAAYATADAFVLPTQTLEGFGLATLEALASGTPVVATPVGGTVEILDGLCERLPTDPLVDGTDSGAIATGMAAWAALDEERRERAGERCRQYVRERYEWDRTVEGVLATYRHEIDRAAPLTAD